MQNLPLYKCKNNKTYNNNETLSTKCKQTEKTTSKIMKKNLSPQKNKSVVANEETIEVCIDIENKISKCYISKNDHQD